MLARSVAGGLRRLFRKDHVERDLSDEIDHYLEMATREYIRTGLSRAEAERAARVDFGGIEAAKEQVRAGGWEAGVDALWRDARHAARGLRRNPAFTVVAVATLALGIGANTAMFSVVNAVLLRPLPYHDARRLVLIWTDDVRRGLREERTASRTIADWRAGSRTLSDVAFYNVQRATLAGSGPRQRSRKAFVSGNLFALLGVSPALGRVISPADERDAAPVAVISHGLWQRRFGGDSSVIGRSLYVEDPGKDGARVFRIVGVMPPDFSFPDRPTELWTPATTYSQFARDSAERFAESARRWTAVGRVKPGASLDDVRADLDAIGRRLSLWYTSDLPDFPGFATNVVPLLDSVARKPLQAALWLLLGAVSLVLLVACANVANLLLARGATRQHEFALRRALGAGRGRLVRQLTVESLVLAAVGGVLGIALALTGTRVLGVVAAARLPRMDEVGMDARVLLFAALVSILSGVVFGVVPALRLSRTDVGQMLKEGGGRAGGGRRERRTRDLLIVAECAMTIVLLAGAGLVLRSLERLHDVDPGFDPRHVLTVRVEFPPETPPPASGGRTRTSPIPAARAREHALSELAARIEALPGVEAVGFVDDMFVAGSGNTSIAIPGRTPDPRGGGELNDGAVSPGFFSALRVPLRRGRYLTREDASIKIHALGPSVATERTPSGRGRPALAEPVVVNDAFARRFFPAEDPIDKRFCTGPAGKAYCYVIVGVIGDMRRQGLERRAIPEYLGPLLPSPSARVDLLVRTQGDPLAAAPTVRQMILSAFPGALLGAVSTAERQLDDFSAQRTFQAWLLTTFAALALVLAAVGIYGVVHYAVAERTREIGIRVALGAAVPDVLRMVIVQGMRVPLVGMGIGIVGALGLTRLTATRLLFETSPTDPLTYAAVTLTLAVVALGACFAPARSAAAIEPVDALRRE